MHVRFIGFAHETTYQIVVTLGEFLPKNHTFHLSKNVKIRKKNEHKTQKIIGRVFFIHVGFVAAMCDADSVNRSEN